MRTREIAPDIHLIDCLFAGIPMQCGSYLVADEKSALVDTGPSVTAENVARGLDGLGIDNLDFILLTHLHLDHAGATSYFLERYPSARVMVDERSAKYMVDPERFLKSAQKALGEIAPHYGTMPAVPEERITPLADGLQLDLGGKSITAVHAPGHSGGHYAFLELQTRALFCGDALGHYIEHDDYIHPATPPPEFDAETSIATAGKLADLEPELLLFPHFGSSREPEEVIEQFVRQVRRSVEAAAELDPSGRTPRALAERLFLDMPALSEDEAGLVMGILEVNAAGVLRYIERSKSPQQQ